MSQLVQNHKSPNTQICSPQQNTNNLHTATSLLLMSPPPSASNVNNSNSSISSVNSVIDSSKPLTGYQHYFKIRQSELRSQDQSLKFGDIVKIVGNEWSKDIDKETKDKFINRGLQDKERYKQTEQSMQQQQQNNCNNNNSNSSQTNNNNNNNGGNDNPKMKMKQIQQLKHQQSMILNENNMVK